MFPVRTAFTFNTESQSVILPLSPLTFTSVRFHPCHLQLPPSIKGSPWPFFLSVFLSRSISGWSGIYHTYLIITITGNGPEEVGALALLISVSRKHAQTYTNTHTTN